jgi:TetR/AcrR family transcriptional regulator, mexJK operon transcriptional repressor
VELRTPVSTETARSDQRRQAIIHAATEVFLQHGYLGATTDEVAARASVSKQTLYRHFADKHTLFAKVILDTTVNVVEGLTGAVVRRLENSDDVPAALRGLAEEWMGGLLHPDVLRLRRLVIAEADRFPEVGKAWYDRGFGPALSILGEALQQLADRGLLRNLGDPTLAAYQFAGLVMYQPMNQAMFAGSAEIPAAEQLSRIADSAVAVFLSAYGPAPQL